MTILSWDCDDEEEHAENTKSLCKRTDRDNGHTQSGKIRARVMKESLSRKFRKLAFLDKKSLRCFRREETINADYAIIAGIS